MASFCAGPLLVAFIKYMLEPEVQLSLRAERVEPLPADVMNYLKTRLVPLFMTDPKFPQVGWNFFLRSQLDFWLHSIPSLESQVLTLPYSTFHCRVDKEAHCHGCKSTQKGFVVPWSDKLSLQTVQQGSGCLNVHLLVGGRLRGRQQLPPPKPLLLTYLCFPSPYSLQSSQYGKRKDLNEIIPLFWSRHHYGRIHHFGMRHKAAQFDDSKSELFKNFKFSDGSKL